jgi:hypothetical protein
MAGIKYFTTGLKSLFGGVDNAASAFKPADNAITLTKVIDEPINIGKATDEIRIVSNQPVYVPTKVVQNTAPQTLYVVEKAADPVMTDMSRAMNEATDILTTATAKTGGSSVLGNLGKVAKITGIASLGYVAISGLLGGSQVLTPDVVTPDPVPFVEKEDDGTLKYITANFEAVNGALGFLQDQIDAIGSFLNDLMNTLFGDGSEGSGGGLIVTGGDGTTTSTASPIRNILLIGGAAAVLIGIIYLITKRGKGKSKKGNGGKK